MSKTRPLSAASPTFRAMADDTAKRTARMVKVVCDDINGVVNDEGNRFRLRGSKGDRIPLQGRSDVKAFSAASSQLVVRGVVRGIPEGFWTLVEYGRQPPYKNGDYIVFSRTNREGSTGYTRSNRAKRQFLSKAQATRRLTKGRSLGDLKPIRTPYGPRQFARPGRHGPIGQPWQRSMLRSQPLVIRDVSQVQGVAMVRRFTGGR